MDKITILFQGDSLTDAGRDRVQQKPNEALGSGFVNLIASRLLYESDRYVIHNRGIGGNRIVDMYARWDNDATHIPFNIISILNGVNDVGFGIRHNTGADNDKFRFVYDRIIYETKESHPDADIILCEPFLLKCLPEAGGRDIYENWELWHDSITGKAEIVRELADKYGAVFVGFASAVEDALKRAPAQHWSLDCIHMTPAGNELLARTWLECARPIIDKWSV